MKPADFMLGILDFFAILLPGVVATWLLSHYLPTEMRDSLRIQAGDHASPVPWVVYLLTSYGLGHFVFMGGSALDTAYDQWRRRTRALGADVPYQAASKLREKLSPTLSGAEFTTLKWAKCYLGIHSPQARLEVDRIEANSKFFRGLVVVSVAAAAHFMFVKDDVALAAGAAVVCALSFSRFCDQRWKMTEITYATAIILHGTKGKIGKAQGAEAGSDDESED